MPKEDFQRKQSLRNLIEPIVFIAVFLFLVLYILIRVNGELPRTISFSGAALIVLASFRFIRALTYDKMFAYVRESLGFDREIAKVDGEEIVLRKKVPYGFRRTLYELITCPWCTGIYTSIFSAFLYFLSPKLWIALFFFAIAGVATFIQLVINLIATKWEIADKGNDA